MTNEKRAYRVTIGNWETVLDADQQTQAKQIAAKRYKEEKGDEAPYPVSFYTDCASARVVEVKSKKYRLEDY